MGRTRASRAENVAHAACTELGGRIFTIGGLLPGFPSGMTSTAVYEYDPVRNAHHLRAPLPAGRRFAAAAAADGKIYLIGGESSLGLPGVSLSVLAYTSDFRRP